jgi:hypothetical protein
MLLKSQQTTEESLINSFAATDGTAAAAARIPAGRSATATRQPLALLLLVLQHSPGVGVFAVHHHHSLVESCFGLSLACCEGFVVPVARRSKIGWARRWHGGGTAAARRLVITICGIWFAFVSDSGVKNYIIYHRLS